MKIPEIIQDLSWFISELIYGLIPDVYGIFEFFAREEFCFSGDSVWNSSTFRNNIVTGICFVVDITNDRDSAVFNNLVDINLVELFITCFDAFHVAFANDGCVVK